MDEERRIEGFQVECYINLRDTEIKHQKPTLTKEWRDWLIAECSTICERMYLYKMKEFIDYTAGGEEDLTQAAFQGIKLTTIRFDPNRIPYVPAKMKRSSENIYADLNDDIYHTKRFAYFVREVLILNKGVTKLKEVHGKRYEPYMLGLKEWLRRQFLSSYQQYIKSSYCENQIRLNRARSDMSAYSSDVSVKQFQNGEGNSSWISDQEDQVKTDRLNAITRMIKEDNKLNGEELLALMLDKYEGFSKGRKEKKEETLFKNFVNRRYTSILEKYGVTKEEALATSESRRKYKVGEQKLKNDFQALTYKAEDILAELKDDY